MSKISDRLEVGGQFFMCESSITGLDKINATRVRLGLKKISPPWHNLYIDERIINENAFCETGLELQERHDFSSTYYFLSRIVNAKIASLNGEEPNYNSLINRIGLVVESFGSYGQSILWIWRKVF